MDWLAILLPLLEPLLQPALVALGALASTLLLQLLRRLNVQLRADQEEEFRRIVGDAILRQEERIAEWLNRQRREGLAPGSPMTSKLHEVVEDVMGRAPRTGLLFRKRTSDEIEHAVLAMLPRLGVGAAIKQNISQRAQAATPPAPAQASPFAGATRADLEAMMLAVQKALKDLG